MLRRTFSRLALAAYLVAATAFSFDATAQKAAQSQASSQQLPVDSKVKIGKLPNGLTYYIRPNAKPEKKVELRLVLNAGSILENDDQQGLAHFMEHMNFNGTKNFPENKLVDYLQSIGVAFGADLNAYTSFDETVYILPIPTDNASNVDNGFKVLSDWAQYANLTDKDIDDERAVVLEESRLGKGANDRMMREYLPVLLAGSQYANRLPIGKDDILKNFKYEAIRSYHRDWYRPNLMAVAVVGDITTAEAEAYIKKHFGGLKNPAKPRDRKDFNMAPYTKATGMVLTDKEATNYMFQLFLSTKKVAPNTTLADYKTDIVKSLFTQILNSRFQELTRAANPPFVFAQSEAGSWLVRNHEGFVLMAMPSDNVENSINVAIAELVKANQFGFTQSELEIAKKQMLSNIEKMYNERNNTNSDRIIDEYVRNFLVKEPIPGIENEYKYYKDFVPAITIDDVNKEAKAWLNSKETENFFALITGPENQDKKLPTNEGLVTIVKNALNQTVTANAEKVVADKLLDKEPTAGKILSETTDKELGATTYTLSNGVKVTVKKTDFKADEIQFTAIKKGGKSNYGVADKFNALMLGDVVEAMGYGNFTPTALTDALSGKTVGLLPEFGEITSSVKGNSSVKDFQTLLELNYLQLTAPRMDKDLFSGFVNTLKTQLQFLSSNPQMAFIDTLTKTLYNNNPNAPVRFPKVADLEKINADRVLEIYKNEFSNADGFHFFIVGNIDENTLKPLMEKYIASLPTKGTTPNFVDNGVKKLAGNNTLEFKKGKDAKALLLAFTYGDIPYSEDLALKTTLLADILSITVIEEVREKMGAIYGGGFNGGIEQYPTSRYTLSGQFPCGPENVQPILKELDKEVVDMKANGPSQANLNKATLAITEKRKENLKTNSYWNAKLEDIIFWSKSKERFLNFDKEMAKITPNDIKNTANLLFNGKNSFNAILLPEDKK